MRTKPRQLILLAVLAGVATYATLDPRGEWLAAGDSPAASERAAGGATAKGSQDAAAKEGAGRFALRERAPLGETQGAPFGSRAWQPSQVTAQAGPPPKPTPPPMPYKFAGKLLQDGKLQVFLSKGDDTIPVQEGETLDGKYRVESIGDDRITLVYLPLKHKETIPVFSLIPNGGALAQPAQVATPARITPQVVQEKVAPAPVPAPNSSPRGPIPTASVISGR